eukprot:9887827-Lingulodinium_polyedra.AAC.1
MPPTAQRSLAPMEEGLRACIGGWTSLAPLLPVKENVRVSKAQTGWNGGRAFNAGKNSKSVE